MLYTAELAARAEAWAARPLTAGPEGRRSAEGLLELATIWAAINQTSLPECIRQCQYLERAASLRAYILEFSRFQTPATMSESTYQLAPQFANEKLVHEGYNKTVDASNLTDEDVKYFQKIGRQDLFVKRGATTDEATATTSEAGSTDTTATRDYAKELTAEQDAHTSTKGKLEREVAAHGKANDALKSEKEAHKATKKELSESQKQLVEAQKQLATLAAKAQEAADADKGDDAADAK